MKPLPVATEYFGFDGRGPSLLRWLYFSDLLFSATFGSDTPNGICGAEYSLPPMSIETQLPSTTAIVVDPLQCPRAWVVFHGLQVIKIIPEEVHSYWQYEQDDSGKASGVWNVVDSDWMASFNPRHLTDHKHFILEFYDEIVEVIARDLIFGPGEFSIERIIGEDGRFAYAFLKRAQVYEKAKNWSDAISDYRSYAALTPDESSAAYALRCAESLATKLN